LKKDRTRRAIADDVREFLANGGSIKKIPMGVSNDKKNKGLTIVAPRKWNQNDV
tara:strand:- start:5079 stop:5240 length:162 start_codon:yes stop_codon:yes gene_type:complete